MSVRGRSRSLKMAPSDRSCMTSYWLTIVSIALSCIVFELFDIVSSIVTLKVGIEVT